MYQEDSMIIGDDSLWRDLEYTPGQNGTSGDSMKTAFSSLNLQPAGGSPGVTIDGYSSFCFG